MSQFIAPNELHGMNEQELRALRGRIMADLRSMGQSVFLDPHIYASLQNIDAAIQRLQQQPKPHGAEAAGVLRVALVLADFASSLNISIISIR